MRYDLLTRNPLLAVQIPRSKVVNKKKQKPHITPEEFDRLVANWGGKGAKKRIKLVRSDAPHDLVFPSLRTGAPMRDGNILRRHLRPAALKLGMDPKKATSRSLRTSCATWMVEAGANPKDVQGQMRHSRISTTMDVYAQHVPESQGRAVAKMMDMVTARRAAQLEQWKSRAIN
ncbi:MAG: tyrosine-type recombinase/integrase [Terriglobales bacterium]